MISNLEKEWAFFMLTVYSKTVRHTVRVHISHELKAFCLRVSADKFLSKFIVTDDQAV